MKKMIWLESLLICCMVLLAANAGLCTVRYVKVGGSGDGTGSSWGNAAALIGTAITNASSGDEIWVAEGTYHEHILVNKWLSIYGGFLGTENTLTDRDWNLHATIIDGEDDVLNEGSVVKIPTGTARVRIDGFTIKRGVGTGVPTTSKSGGGIYCQGDNVYITNNLITDNHCAATSTGTPVQNYGGGIRSVGGSAIITNNTITDNGCEGSGDYALDNGGGIACITGATVSGNLISGNTCASNHWAMGAGIHCETGCFGPSVVITDNVVTDNAITGTGTTTAMGGGIFANGYVSIRHNTIANNATPGLGGGVYATNSSSYCPAVVTVANNTIGSNVAGTGGGGIYCGSYGTGKVVVSNNVLQSNACTSGTGGGILSSNYAQAPTITNNTITGSQQATNGGGISCNQGTVTNNIIAHNCSGTYYSGSTPPAIAFTYNDSYDNTSYNYQNFTAGTGCITSNPTLAEDGIHLMSSSSCVDVGYDAATGLQSTEIDGGDRLVDIPSIGSTEVDIGADEYEPANTEFSVGLPTTNLNNAAGASRSNVRWGNADYTIGYGDSFTPSSNCTVYGLRVWAVPDIPVVPAYLLGDHYGDISLYVNTTPTGMTKLSGGNLLAGSNSTTNPSIRIAPVSYPQNPGVNYQAANGRFQQIWQIDFTGLNWALTADQTYVLGVTATPRVDRYWFLHATCPSSGTADFYTFDTGDLTQEPSAVTGYAWLLKYSNINFELFTR